MSIPPRGHSRFTLDLPIDLHRGLRRYAFENDLAAAEVVRGLLSDFLAAKSAGDAAVEAALFRRGFLAGTTAERDRISRAVGHASGAGQGLPTSPPPSVRPAN